VTLDPLVLAAIAAMAAATFLTRAGGYLLFRAFSPPLVRGMLAYVPGTLFVSYVAPALANGGVQQQWAGAAATLAVMLATRNLALAILGGTAAAGVVWAAG